MNSYELPDTPKMDSPEKYRIRNVKPYDESKKELTTSEKIQLVGTGITEVLLEKNKRYGDSALHPINIFSKENASNSIAIRLDDKLSRVKNSKELRKNDIADLIGYLMLLCAANGWTNFKDQID